MTKQDPFYAGAKLFNALPTSLKNVKSTMQFAKRLKEYLFEGRFYTINEFCEQF
jgi:hypothetical protein